MNKQKLRELAEKAAISPWADNGGYAGVQDANGDTIANIYGESRKLAINTTEYIIAANPSTILALLDENAALLGALRMARTWIGDGENSDDAGLSRDHFTREYAAAIDAVDVAIAKYSES